MIDVSTLDEKDQEILKYYLMYLSDRCETVDEMIGSEYGEKLNELIGSGWSDWLIELVKLDPVEVEVFKDITSDGTLRPYFMGDENSFAYRWLIQIWRELQFQKLEI